jgi:protein subunit release factor A
MKKELLFSITKKDLKIQTFKSGGPGGQHQNKTDSGVRIIHSESGGVGESREQRSQYQNKKIALQRLVKHPKFKIWHSRKCAEIIEGKTIEEIVDEMMDEKNLKVEVKEDGKWVKKEVMKS